MLADDPAELIGDMIERSVPACFLPVEYRREQEFAGKLAGVGAGLTIKDATPMFAKLRQIKSQREMDILQHAVDITAEAFQRTYAVAVPGTWEYEIQAQFEFTFLRRNGHWGYPCIVGCGVNATTLHYDSNKDRMKDGDLLLMDDAAEFDQYSVDVTRTIPVNGKFTNTQADIYRLVYDAQMAGIGKARAGHTMTGGAESVQGAATAVFKQGLYKLGLITDPESDQQVRTWFFHGIGHGIGLNVHDPGGRELAPGMVVTVEPGIYIRPDALDNLPKTPEMEKFAAAVRPAFEKYKGIGVRIEDDVVIRRRSPGDLGGIHRSWGRASIAKLPGDRASPPWCVNRYRRLSSKICWRRSRLAAFTLLPGRLPDPQKWILIEMA
jgi:Xaa-Pro aminopeptidase